MQALEDARETGSRRVNVLGLLHHSPYEAGDY
jgi:hypothetical protein